MNKRMLNIITDLYQLDITYTIESLSKKYNVSSRTIRNDLNSISDFLKENHISELSLDSGGIIKRNDDFINIKFILDDNDPFVYKLSKKERVRISAVLLVNSINYLTLSAIAEQLFVSRATIINDLKDIKNFLQKHDLYVSSHPNKGLRVEGLESKKRIFLMNMVKEAHHNSMVSKFMSVQAGNKAIVKKIIVEQEHTWKSYLTDGSFQEILLYLGIMINRNILGEYIEPLEKINNDKYLMSQSLLKYISQYCHINTTEDEIQFLSQLLVQCQYIYQNDKENSIIKTQIITRRFIDQISFDLGINLNDDYEFFENLSNHLKSVLKPIRPNYPESSILDEVLEANQNVVEAVNRNLYMIQQNVNRPIDKIEIGYIAIHICAALERKKNKEIAFHVIVACHAGIGTSRLLIEKLKKHFNFRIIDVISAHEAESIDENEADLIISTVPIHHCKIETVTVSSLLNDEDYIKVGNKIDALRNSKRLPSRIKEKKMSAGELIRQINAQVYTIAPEKHHELMKMIKKTIRDYFQQSIEADAEIFSPYLHHLLTPERIQLDVECKTWQEAVRLSAMPLLEEGYIEERYIQAMIDNIEENGPYVVLSKGFAVPHEGLEKGTIQVGMNLIRLKKPVCFGIEELDPVEFVCCLSAIDHKIHLKAFFNLVNMLKNEDFKEQLKKCKTSQEAALVIEKYEYTII